MKTIKYFAAFSLIVCLFGCKSNPDLDGFRRIEISNNMVDTMSANRLTDFKQTIEKEHLFGFFVLNTSEGKSESGPAKLKEWKESLNMPDSIKPIYKDQMTELVFYPEVTYQVESKFLGIYQRRKTTIKGIKLGMITKEEEEYIKSIKIK